MCASKSWSEILGMVRVEYLVGAIVRGELLIVWRNRRMNPKREMFELTVTVGSSWGRWDAVRQGAYE